MGCSLPLNNAEAQFALVSTTAEAVRFSYVLVGLGEEAVELVCNVLEGCSYTRLKGQFIERLSVSETVKLKHLLREVLHEMKKSAPTCYTFNGCKRFPGEHTGRHELHVRPMVADVSCDN